MKKFFALFLVLACFVAAGCDNGAKTTPAPAPKTTPSSSAPTPPPETPAKSGEDTKSTETPK